PICNTRVTGPEEMSDIDATADKKLAADASAYDRIARLYDPWSRSVVEDVAFYVAEARKAAGRAGLPSGTPVVGLGIGTGRIAVPVAEAGIDLIGVDSSRGMLEVCRWRAAAAGL